MADRRYDPALTVFGVPGGVLSSIFGPSRGGSNVQAPQVPSPQPRQSAFPAVLGRLTSRKAETASGRLRRRIEREAAACARPGRIMIEGGRAAELWPSYISVGYHVTRRWVPAMHLTLKRCESAGFAQDPVARMLARYLEHHIEEENHPSKAGGPGGAVLDDLAVIGARPDVCPDRIARHFEWLHDAVWQQHPVAVIGCVQLERFHPRREAVDELIRATGFPRQAFHQMLVHCHVDVKHTQELDDLIDALPLHPWQENLILEAALATVRAVQQSLMDAVTGPGYVEGHRVLGVLRAR